MPSFRKAANQADRGIRYTQHYDLGGLRWNRSFSAASQHALGWSAGTHSLGHSYTQERLNDPQRAGHVYTDALEIVSQEMRHFRVDITMTDRHGPMQTTSAKPGLQ